MDIVERYLSEMEHALKTLSRSDLRTIIEALEQAWLRRATVYIIGNGGSASTASHMMNDLCKFTRVPGAAPFKAVALTDNVPFMTAIANDCSYDDVFAAALDVVLEPKDVLIAISGSGNSPNVLKACEFAQSRGATVLSLIGNTGGKQKYVSTHSILVPAERIGQQEDGHLIINHTIALALRERIEAQVALHARMPTVQGEVDGSGANRNGEPARNVAV